ncbi:uncharacterized protein F4822DRAFT_276009 [Hypoxylon trugodes]|uniref:uncharacterized protein n=1 Tax=Hypoxylon trugodes TaxID=326681 RepID=UPI00219CC42B|nr:uncharacterized protein F4822DRAFT_276009 [Hypoxylon trugodes]KAI1387181.1 hypothetical protein F4822DRAFT_276009 [Hypoxylon trugodes]
MFLHSGASLHGHEYSNRPTSQPGHRRNTILRSAFATPISRTSSYRTSTDSTSDVPNPTALRRATFSAQNTPKFSDAVVRFQEPECYSTPPAKPEAMSEDEGSIASDSDASRVSSSVRQTRRRVPRKSTTFILAHPPPKFRSKQRLIPIRPMLLLQMQLLSANRRPRPAIDVYPSSAIAGSLIAPLLKRFPRIARIKRELNIQDVMLVKSEDYAAQSSGSESDDGDADDIKSRELLAILSPARTEDKAEIVLADGTVWIATPRSNGVNTCSYEFVTVDPKGNTTTARWVRKQVATKSLPVSPTPAGSTSPAPPAAADCKFTFSIIDPNCRRHPIMATLTNSSLDILDTYTTVSQSASRYPPTSPMASPAASLVSEENPFERTTQPVEDWQRTFITISAVWVILRHGWSPNSKAADFGPLGCLPTTTTDNTVGRSRSLSVNSNIETKSGSPEGRGRRKFSGALRMNDQGVPATTPRRATSTGSSFILGRNARETKPLDQPSDSPERVLKKNKRAFSGDWGATIANRSIDNSLAAMLDSPPKTPQPEASTARNTSSLAPPPLSMNRRAVSAYYTVDRTPLKFDSSELEESPDIQRDYFQTTPQKGQEGSQDRKAKHQKWKSMANWFRKLQGR